MDEKRDVLTPKDVAKELQITPRRVSQLIKSGALRAKLVNGTSRCWRIRREWLVDFMEADDGTD